MSTIYYVGGRGKRLTLDRMRALVRAHDGDVTEHEAPRDRSPDCKLLAIGPGFLWVHRTRGTAWHTFERWGRNTDAAFLWIRVLEEAGYTITSEHDE